MLPIACGTAFAWGPAIDLLIEVLWTSRGTTHGAGRIGLTLVSVVARYAIARFAFRAATPLRTAVRLAALTLLLGATQRLAYFWPLVVAEGAGGHLALAIPSLLSAPLLVAAYASLLPILLEWNGGALEDRGRAIAAAALWIAFGQAPQSHFGYFDAADCRVPFLGIDWRLRVALGVIVPFVVATAAVAGKLPTPAGAVRLGTTWLQWAALPATLFLMTVLSAIPVFRVFDPFVIGFARAPNGTEIVLSEVENDPYDVLLTVRRPGEGWVQLPFVRAEPLWSGRIDVAAQGTTATVSVFGVIAAQVDYQSGAVTRIAPMTWFPGDRWYSAPDALSRGWLSDR